MGRMALANGMMSVGIAIGFITYHLGRARARIGNAGGLGGVSIYHDQRTEQTRTEQNRTGLEDQMIQIPVDEEDRIPPKY